MSRLVFNWPDTYHACGVWLHSGDAALRQKLRHWMHEDRRCFYQADNDRDLMFIEFLGCEKYDGSGLELAFKIAEYLGLELQ